VQGESTLLAVNEKMKDTVLIHGDHWKVSDVKEEVEWCRKQKWAWKIFVPRDAMKQKHSWSEHKESKTIHEGCKVSATKQEVNSSIFLNVNSFIQWNPITEMSGEFMLRLEPGFEFKT
jgi:hypothetical protein